MLWNIVEKAVDITCQIAYNKDKQKHIINLTRKGDYMSVAVNNDYNHAIEAQQKEVRDMVLAGLENIKEGKTKDFNEVCDRLEKKSQ